MPKQRKLGPKGTPFFGAVATFEEAYPDLEEVQISIESLDKNIVTKEPEVKLLFSDKSQIAPYVYCGNPLCNEGGFSIQEIVNSVYLKRLTEGSGTVICRGHEHMGRWQQRGCGRGANYWIKAKYVSSESG